MTYPRLDARPLVGVTVLPEFFQVEGVDGVLDNLARRAGIVPLQPGAVLEQIPDVPEPSMDKTPERSAQRAEVRRLLEAQIDQLPDDYRTVFVLRAVEEMSVDETAAVLKIPPATVRSRLFRARSLLREGLATRIDLACEEAFGFAGARCDRVVANVMQRITRGAA